MSVHPGDGGFDPLQLTPDASLNRVLLGDVSGVPRELVGQVAGDVCSRDALLELAAAAGITGLDPARLGTELATLAAATTGIERRKAEEVLQRFGVRLGALIATLRHTRTPTAQGQTSTRYGYLAYWLTVDRVWLAGGLLRPGMQDAILRGARSIVARAERPCPVSVVSQAPLAPLLGAARHALTRDGSVAVADLGHSTVKTALARVRGGAVVDLQELPPLPTPTRAEAREVERAVTTALTAAARRAGSGGAGVEVVVSVASYLDSGLPLDDGRGAYSRLRGAVARVTEVLCIAGGPASTLRFVHDGTAAAAATGDVGSSATIAVGTWLGIGFTPPSQPLLALSPELTISR